MDVKKFLNDTFDRHTSEEFCKRFDGLYYEELQKKYEDFITHDDIYVCIKPKDIKTDILSEALNHMKEQNKKTLPHEVVLLELETQRDQKTMTEFYEALSTNNEVKMREIIETRDPEGVYMKLFNQMTR